MVITARCCRCSLLAQCKWNVTGILPLSWMHFGSLPQLLQSCAALFPDANRDALMVGRSYLSRVLLLPWQILISQKVTWTWGFCEDLSRLDNRLNVEWKSHKSLSWWEAWHPVRQVAAALGFMYVWEDRDLGALSSELRDSHSCRTSKLLPPYYAAKWNFN